MEKKKRAMKRTQAGEASASSLAPAGAPQEQGHDEDQTSALTSYLRRESVKLPIPRMSKLPFKRAKSRKNAPPGKADAGGEHGLEMAPVGTEKQRTMRAWKLLNEKEGVEDSDSSTNGSDDGNSLSAPGLSGLVVAQLTWGAGHAGWDAALREGEEEGDEGEGGGKGAADIREHPIVAAAAAAAAAATAALGVADGAGRPGSGGARSHEQLQQQQQGGGDDVGRTTADAKVKAEKRW